MDSFSELDHYFFGTLKDGKCDCITALLCRKFQRFKHSVDENFQAIEFRVCNPLLEWDKKHKKL